MAYGFTFFNYRNLFIPPNNSLKTQCENVETYFQAYNRLVDFSTSKSIYGQSTWQCTSMQFKINFLYHTCYNVFQFPRENCNDRYIHHLASSLSQECKGILKFTHVTAQYQHRIDVCCLFINLESIYSHSTGQISEEKKVQIAYLS